MHELYIYYRVAVADEATLAARTATLAADMHALDATLRVRWLRRAGADAEPAPATATWMEVWTRPGGIDAALAAQIDAAARRALGQASTERHVEVFEPLPVAAAAR